MSDLEFDPRTAPSGDATTKKSKTKKDKTIEERYKKLSPHEHILKRPDTYIGSVEHSEQEMWVWDTESEKMVLKTVKFVPGLYKIFDEILVNAADNRQRDSACNLIKIEIDVENNRISIWNNGKGIEVVEHKEHKMWTPELIFGHLLTSSNYDDDEEKTTGGRNGYGAKLTNIFSTRFLLETSCKQYRKKFKLEWKNNMLKKGSAKISPTESTDFTKVTFEPDLEKFGMTHLDNDIVAVLSRRAYDVAATSGCRVFLNGIRLAVTNFKNYCELFLRDTVDHTGTQVKIVHEKVNDNWEIAVAVSDSGFKHMSFVNSIATTKGGKHLDYVTNQVTKKIKEKVASKVKNTKITDFYIKNHMWVFCNALIANPTFDSQTKETMTLVSSKFARKDDQKCELKEDFFKKVMKSGLVEAVASYAEFKNQKKLEHKGGHKTNKIKGVPKLDDANMAGTKDAEKCTLILTEGDSAKSTAVSGLGAVKKGRDFYGIFPLKGKLLNVREAGSAQIGKNEEITNLCKIMGLNYTQKYSDNLDLKKLRYGKIMIMTDQDHDGSHIKGLLINFIHCKWPNLIKYSLLEEFITPIVKVTKGQRSISFYSMPEFEEWQNDTPNATKWSIKYYKGLGTSSAKEAKEYFSDMKRHKIPFRYGGNECDKAIELAFAKKHVDDRKTWLTGYMNHKKELTESGESEEYLYKKDTKYLTYKEFVDKELILFSHADLSRSVPGMVDGLKPGQRKILYTFFNKYKNTKKEIKVAQASGGVSEYSAYHHGEVSLQTTIVGMAQNFVGANNLNLLMPNGQFGTRLNGGKDSASPRYIFTQVSPLGRLLFPPEDDNLLKLNQDDGMIVEPEWYCPILPLVLVNGTDGIGTGWSTKIPNHDIREVAENIKRMIRGEDPLELHPKYKNYRGTIEKFEENRYVVNGEIAQLDETSVEITELPVKTWTYNYRDTVLDSLEKGREFKEKDGKTSMKDAGLIKSYQDHSTDTTVRFVVEFASAAKLREAEAAGMHKFFKCQSTMTHENTLTLFDHNGCLQRYKSTTDILKDFYHVRMQKYIERKEYLIGKLTAEFDKLANQVRFIKEICDKKIVITNKKKVILIEMMQKAGYEKDPLNAWKLSRMTLDEQRHNAELEAENSQEPEDSQSTSSSSKKGASSVKEDSDSKGYEYLLGMPLWSLTHEKKEKLERQMEDKNKDLAITKKTTKEQFWFTDLDAFLEALDKLEDQEKKEEEDAIVKAEKKAGSKSSSKFDAFGRSASSKIKKINLKRETLPAEDWIRFEPKFEAPKASKARKTSGEVKAEKAEKEEKARVKKEQADEKAKDKAGKAAKGTKKLVDYGFCTTTKVTTKMENATLNDDSEEVKINVEKGKAALSSKPKKSALKKEQDGAEARSEARSATSTKRPPKKRKKMDWETDSEDKSEEEVVSDATISVTSSENDFKVKLPSRKKPTPTKKQPVQKAESHKKLEPKQKEKSPKSKPKKNPNTHVIEDSSDEEEMTVNDLSDKSSDKSSAAESSEEEIVAPSRPVSSRRAARARKPAPKYCLDSTQDEDQEESDDDDDSSFEMVD